MLVSITDQNCKSVVRDIKSILEVNILVSDLIVYSSAESDSISACIYSDGEVFKALDIAQVLTQEVGFCLLKVDKIEILG